MNRFLVVLLYNLALPLLFLLALPSWLIRMFRRGGFGSGMMQRLGLFKWPAEKERKGGIYIHSVSVGETLMALKLIRQWQSVDPDEHFVLVPTTATGHAVAMDQAPERVRVIYSPFDFSFIVRKVMRRMRPRLVVLIESELWPNLLRVCQAMEIPVAIANARLSVRSERRYQKFRWLLSPLFSMVSLLLTQEERDRERWLGVGVKAETIRHTGSMKFDLAGDERPKLREEFKKILSQYSKGRKIVMMLSTFAGEERAIAQQLAQLKDELFLVFVPRHMERRMEVSADLSAVGYEPVLRSDLVANQQGDVALVVDSTGELRDWTAHADIAIVGKSWLAKGGQNPSEAIAAHVPLILGPRMDNFEPLVSSLVAHDTVFKLGQVSEIEGCVRQLLENYKLVADRCEQAESLLCSHLGATSRTVNQLRALSTED